MYPRTYHKIQLLARCHTCLNKFKQTCIIADIEGSKDKYLTDPNCYIGKSAGGICYQPKINGRLEILNQFISEKHAEICEECQENKKAHCEHVGDYICIAEYMKRHPPVPPKNIIKYHPPDTRQYITLRIEIYDNPKCARCGETYCYDLEKHHINKNPKDNSAKNLLILCTECHHELHNKSWVLQEVRYVTNDLTPTQLTKRQQEEEDYCTKFNRLMRILRKYNRALKQGDIIAE